MKALATIILVLTCSSCITSKSLKTPRASDSDFFEKPKIFEPTAALSRYWAINNYLVYFVSNVNEDNRNLSPIIYVHGLGGSLDDFSELIKSIHHSRFSRPFYALDLPGFGKSLSHNSEISIRKYSDLLSHFVLMLSTSKVSLVCHSMGGQVCIDFALTHPDQIQLLTLISPAGVYQKSTYINQTLNHYVGMSVGRIDHPKVKSFGDMSWLNHDFARKLLTSNSTALMAIESFRDNFHSRINQLKTKTLILWGRNDTVFSFENGLYLKENIEDSTLYVLENADHFPLKSHASYISNLILKYL